MWSKKKKTAAKPKPTLTELKAVITIGGDGKVSGVASGTVSLKGEPSKQIRKLMTFSKDVGKAIAKSAEDALS